MRLHRWNFAADVLMASNSILGILGGGVWHFVPKRVSVSAFRRCHAVLPAASFNTPSGRGASARETAPSPSGGAEPSVPRDGGAELSPSLQPELDAAKSSAGSEQTGGEAA